MKASLIPACHCSQVTANLAHDMSPREAYLRSSATGCDPLVHRCMGPFQLPFQFQPAGRWSKNYSDERSIEISPSRWSVHLKNYYSNYILWVWVIFLFLKKYFTLPISFSTFPFGVVWLHGEMWQLVTWKYLTKRQIPQLWHTCGPHIWT